ncbi:hypothetical protein ACWDOP_00235 [Nocardia sp. NPDC003693]
MTESVDLHMIARLQSDAAVVDIFCCEVFYDAEDGHALGRSVGDWWESVSTDPDVPVSLESLDALLTASGYERSTDWQRRVAESGAVRFFADAVAYIEELDR